MAEAEQALIDGSGLRHRAANPAVDRVRGERTGEYPKVDTSSLSELSPRSRDALIDRLSPTALRELARRKARHLVLGDVNKSLRAALIRELYRPVRVKLRDKLTFWLSVMGLLATQYVLLARPHLFWAWFTLLSIPLLAWRCFSFTRRKWGFFLLDFCYAANGLAALHVWVAPKDPYLFEAFFMLANGPVLWAVLAWRNSMVFHDYEKMTSVYIHLIPALLSFAQRWHYPSALNGRPQDLPAYLACVPIADAGRHHMHWLWSGAVAISPSPIPCAGTGRGGAIGGGVGGVDHDPHGWHVGSGGLLGWMYESIVKKGWGSVWSVHEPLSPSPGTGSALLQHGKATGQWDAPLLTGFEALQSWWASITMAGNLTASSSVASSAAAQALAEASSAELGLPMSAISLSDFAAARLTTCDHSFWRVMGIPILLYAVWQVGYLLLTEYFVAHTLASDAGILTSLRWMARSKGGMGGMALQIGRCLRVYKREEEHNSEDARTKALFVSIQLLYTFITLAPTKIWYDHYYAHAALLIFITSSAIWQGGAYYIEEFAIKYQKRLKRAEEAVSIASAVGVGAERSGTRLGLPPNGGRAATRTASGDGSGNGEGAEGEESDASAGALLSPESSESQGHESLQSHSRSSSSTTLDGEGMGRPVRVVDQWRASGADPNSALDSAAVLLGALTGNDPLPRGSSGPRGM